MVWYSHLFKNFPQFIVIHTVKGLGIVNKAEIDVILELSCFFDDPADVGNLISGSSGGGLTLTLSQEWPPASRMSQTRPVSLLSHSVSPLPRATRLSLCEQQQMAEAVMSLPS